MHKKLIIILMEIKKYLEVYENYENYKKIEKIAKIAKVREVVFLCVGNSKVWFDSFGPIIGSLLKIMGLNNFVYGNIVCNINPSNIEFYVNSIYKFHTNPFIVVIDSAISENLSDCLIFKEGSVKCSCLNNKAIDVGDFYIAYNINKDYIKNVSNYKNLLLKVKDVVRIFKNCFL